MLKLVVLIMEKHLSERFLLWSLRGFLVVLENNFIFSQYFHQKHLLNIITKFESEMTSISSRLYVVEH
jgi:hypothetical protein